MTHKMSSFNAWCIRVHSALATAVSPSTTSLLRKLTRQGCALRTSQGTIHVLSTTVMLAALMQQTWRQ